MNPFPESAASAAVARPSIPPGSSRRLAPPPSRAPHPAAGLFLFSWYAPMFAESWRNTVVRAWFWFV